ncbi:MAG: GNAT family N-acetyltransferase [Fibrobacterales bacterium]
MKPGIRIATIDDVDTIVPLLTELFAQDIEFVPDVYAQKIGVSEIISSPDFGTIFLAEIDNQIIGMLNTLYTISTAKGGKVAIFEDMIITRGHQGNGYGSHLLKFGIDYVNNLSISRITLLTDFDNYNAISFYEKHGFSKSAMIPYRLQLVNG